MERAVPLEHRLEDRPNPEKVDDDHFDNASWCISHIDIDGGTQDFLKVRNIHFLVNTKMLSYFRRRLSSSDLPWDETLAVRCSSSSIIR